MNTSTPINASSPFDSIRKFADDGNEYWSARDLMPLLGYDNKWQNFVDAVERAKVSASAQKFNVHHHFTDASKMVELGSGARRNVQDFHLTRFACYLVAMNGDPRKSEIAAAQTYFAVKTREAETRVDPDQGMTRKELAKFWYEAEERAELHERALKPWLQPKDDPDGMTVAQAADELTRNGWQFDQNGLMAELRDELNWAQYDECRNNIPTKWAIERGYVVNYPRRNPKKSVCQHPGKYCHWEQVRILPSGMAYIRQSYEKAIESGDESESTHES